jgi:hypothetical protein
LFFCFGGGHCGIFIAKDKKVQRKSATLNEFVEHSKETRYNNNRLLTGLCFVSLHLYESGLMNFQTNVDQIWKRRIQVLAILYCFFGILQVACGVIYLFFDTEFISHVWDKIFFQLPEIENILSVVIWIYAAIANVLIFIGAIVLLIAWEILAPVIAFMSIPSLVGGIGTIYKRRWAFKVLFFTSFFYGLLFFPTGIIITILTVKAYRYERRRIVASELKPNLI